jgi:cellulose synthase/poly-beta-1,6-N-acetylglucosamine synthase-like glycosyltransferase
MTRAFCVCVPARNEAERLPRLLDALAAQEIEGIVPVSICVNNSDDDSHSVLERSAARHAGRLRLIVEHVALEGVEATVGVAPAAIARPRATLLGDPVATLISTDADCRPPSGWIGATLAAMADERTIVGGRLVIDDAEPLPPAVTAIRARWDRYWAQVRAIEDAIDPRAWDPPPRHGDHTGASIALSVALYEAAGGVPPLARGEDTALVAAAIAAGGRLVHPASVWTRVSPRREGRAPGGMALDIDRSHALADADLSPLAPALTHWRARALWRAARRAAGLDDAAIVAAEAALPAMPSDLALPDAG